MDYKCKHCSANLDRGDVFEHFLAVYPGDEKKALTIARSYGWLETNRIHFNSSIIVQPDKGEQYVICPECKEKDPLLLLR
jgi:hypothetical protein